MSESGRPTRAEATEDSRASVEADLSGLEQLRRVMAGDAPPAPFSASLGMRALLLEAGRVVFTATPDEHHYNLIGTVHGGYTATLLDTAMGCAVLSALSPGMRWTTLELKINYLRPLTAQTGEVRCEGVTIHTGRTTALAEGRITDAAGKLYAHGTTTCLVLRG